MFKKITAVVLVLAAIVCVFSACAFTPDKKIVGAWQDTSGLLVLEFKEGGVLSAKGNLSAIVPSLQALNTDISGTYTTAKDEAKKYHVTVNVSLIFSASIEFIIEEVTKDVLTLKAVDSGKVYTFTKYSPTANPAPSQGADSTAPSAAGQ